MAERQSTRTTSINRLAILLLGHGASTMLAADMAMRLRKTHGNSQQLRLRLSLNGFRFAHDHAGR